MAKKTAKIFTADRYMPTKFHSAEDKAKFANHFVRFVESGFKPTLFPKWFYNRLSNTFSHIAHFNRGGFYATWFDSLDSKIKFLVRLRDYPGYGSPEFTYCDVERDISKWIGESGLIEILRKEQLVQQEASERATLARLKQKYPEAT